MLKRWASWPSGIRWLAGIAAVALAAAIMWALFVPLADWLARHDVGAAKPALLQTARDAARGRLLTLAAGLFAAGALVFTALNFSLSRRTFELTGQGQVTDRFTRAIGQLGSDRLDVRIGGIYALERIARDSAKDHPTVMEVLLAFIREHADEPWPESDTAIPEAERVIRPDVQAAVTVVGRRDRERDINYLDLELIDLAGVHLVGANLGFAHLDFVRLAEADLTRADLGFAHLENAVLNRANLTRANLTGAYLTGADLTDADLTDADLSRAKLAGANLTRANLTDADLVYADLVAEDLTTVHPFADLTDADLTRANVTYAKWPNNIQVPEGWLMDKAPGPSSGRLKREDQLSEVMDHYL